MYTLLLNRVGLTTRFPHALWILMSLREVSIVFNLDVTCLIRFVRLLSRSRLATALRSAIATFVTSGYNVVSMAVFIKGTSEYDIHSFVLGSYL